MSLLRRLKSKASVLVKQPHLNALRGVPLPHLTGEAAQIEIARAIAAGGEMVGRIGETEGEAIRFYLGHRLASLHPAPYAEPLRRMMKRACGLFPTDDAMIDRFCALSLAAARASDVYAAWTPHDRLLTPHSARRIRLADLDPFFTRHRWTLALAGRRVTVVSPFERSIRAQFDKRAALFAQPVLPDLILTTVCAPQTHVGADVSGQDWHGNLAALDRAVTDSAPEVMIVGAGGYGLPLAAAAKARGATAIVLGGSTQLLFGIIGNRWLNDPQYRRLVNPHWRRPDAGERPEGYDGHEIAGGAYW